MLRKGGLFSFIVLLWITTYANGAFATTDLETLQHDDLHILLIYSTNGNTYSPHVKMLDLLLHHFSQHVTIVADDEVTHEDFQTVTHLFYYGEHEKNLPDLVTNGINQFSGTVVVIGKNNEQFTEYKELTTEEIVQIEKLGKNVEKEKTSLPYLYPIPNITVAEDWSVLLHGYKGEEKHPLLMKKGKNYYFASADLNEIVAYYFADVLHDILPNTHASEHVAYLRLEDIHPMTDPKKLLEVGEYLNERNIPYILVVIPVYITPETGERVYYSDSPEIVQVLQYLQSTSGTIIAHGYTHQYRDSETGEGFEFWDVENGQFITEMTPNVAIEQNKQREDFANEAAYAAYIDALKENERKYIEQRMEQSIHELVSHQLYPLAFEAPHYTMSQQGYGITSNYFSSILGQIQLSDEFWEVMGTPPYISSAQFLNGMTLYPETIGYVDLSLEQPFRNTEKQLKKALIVRDSIVSGFYHPYLGVEYLPEFLAFFEQVPNVRWINLKETKQSVATDKVKISTDPLGDIQVKSDLTWLDNLKGQTHLTFVEKVLWGITVVVFLFVVLFLLLTLQLRIRMKKRLFEERKKVG